MVNEAPVARIARTVTPGATPAPPGLRSVRIPAYGEQLAGELTPLPRKGALVVVVHTGSTSRTRSHVRAAAATLSHGPFATLLIDLLTPAETMADGESRLFGTDVPFLSRRLVDVVDWAVDHVNLPIALFAVGNAAAAAMVAAVMRSGVVRASVVVDGRPDRAAGLLPRVAVPTLFVVGENDEDIIAHNESAMRRIPAAARLEIVDGGSWQNEDAARCVEAARLAREWYAWHVVDEGD